MRLAHDQDLRGKFHVAAAANAVMHAHDNVFALALEQPFVALTHGFVHRGGQLGPASLQFGEFLLQILLALAELRDLAFRHFFYFVGFARQAAGLLLHLLGLFHQNDFLILNLRDVGLARFDFVGERAILLVLARQKLLVGVFLDLRFFPFNVEFELFAVGLDLFDAGPGGFELRLGGRGFGAEGFAFRSAYFSICVFFPSTSSSSCLRSDSICLTRVLAVSSCAWVAVALVRKVSRSGPMRASSCCPRLILRSRSCKTRRGGAYPVGSGWRPRYPWGPH